MKYGVFVATPRGCQQALRLVQALQDNHGAAGEYQDSYESLQGEAEVFVHFNRLLKGGVNAFNAAFKRLPHFSALFGIYKHQRYTVF